VAEVFGRKKKADWSPAVNRVANFFSSRCSFGSLIIALLLAVYSLFGSLKSGANKIDVSLAFFPTCWNPQQYSRHGNNDKTKGPYPRTGTEFVAYP
jgi:hypothetical protein